MRKTIESIVHQSFQNYEYIIIDGGSKDNTLSVIQEYANKIDYWVSEPDKGIYHAMNKGLKAATGEYVHFLNGGDLYANDEVLTQIFSEQRFAPLLQGIQICDYGNRQERWMNAGETEASLYDLYTHTLLHQATLIKRELFDKYGFYDETLKIVSDWKFFFQAILGGERTQFLNFEIVIFEMFGISSDRKYIDLQKKEKAEQLELLMPHNMMRDYKRLHQLELDYYIIKFIKSNSFFLNSFKVFRKICLAIGIGEK